MNDLFPDIPRLYTALAEWAFSLLFIMLLRRKIKGWKFVLTGIVALVVQSVFLISTKNLPIYFWVPCMIVAVLLMLLFITFTCEVEFIDGCYFCVQAFVAAEFVASLQWQIHCYLFIKKQLGIISQGILLIGVYSVIWLILWGLLRKNRPINGSLRIRGKQELASSIIIGIAIFAISNISFVTNQGEINQPYMANVFAIRTLVDFGGVAILYAHYVQCHELRVRKELERMESFVKNQYLQFQQSKESIELINYKYHDLKHQIAAIREEKDLEKREDYLRQMEEDIIMYEAQNKTGNPVLDQVLTSKSLFCAKNDISFTCVADGSLLNFMNTMDLCSIFGNALDNAVESVMKISEKEKRLIHTSVYAQKNFLVIRFENYNEEELNFQEGLPKTTKKDRDFHGYGIKSIKHTVKKYNGMINIRSNNQWFQLQILIPLQKESKKKLA